MVSTIMPINWQNMWSLEEAASPQDDHLELDEVIDNFSNFLVERHMGVPALWFLESCRPLAFLGGQTAFFLSPLAAMLGLGNQCQKVAHILTSRSRTNALLNKLESSTFDPTSSASTTFQNPPSDTSASDK